MYVIMYVQCSQVKSENPHENLGHCLFTTKQNTYSLYCGVHVITKRLIIKHILSLYYLCCVLDLLSLISVFTRALSNAQYREYTTCIYTYMYCALSLSYNSLSRSLAYHTYHNENYHNHTFGNT